MSQVLTTYETPVLPEWVDYNGHLRDAFYLLVFSYATDALMAHIGLDSQNRDASGHSLFTLECHLNFLHEVKEGARVECVRNCSVTIASACISTMPCTCLAAGRRWR